MLNFVAVGSAGGGDIVAWPSDHTQPNSSIINYTNSANVGFLNIANGIVLPVRQDHQGADITLEAQVSDTDVLADVVGYFSNLSPTPAGGVFNLFLGTGAGNPSATTGDSNTALGLAALFHATSGFENTAVGLDALLKSTTGSSNTAAGVSAMQENMTGSNNTAIGQNALVSNKTGFGNIAIGYQAGMNIVAGGVNIDIGAFPNADESSTIRIGDPQAQFRTFIAGIDGVTSSGGTAVFVNSSGQLGTVTSSLRFKEDVQDMGEASAGLLLLRPVTFRYKPEYDDGSRLLQYGLIAEEVANIYPDLVQYDSEGQPQAVRYNFVNAMLLNEVQKQHGRIMTQDAEISSQRARIDDLEARLARVEATTTRQH
jgi:hypothetical protein